MYSCGGDGSCHQHAILFPTDARLHFDNGTRGRLYIPTAHTRPRSQAKHTPFASPGLLGPPLQASPSAPRKTALAHELQRGRSPRVPFSFDELTIRSLLHTTGHTPIPTGFGPVARQASRLRNPRRSTLSVYASHTARGLSMSVSSRCVPRCVMRFVVVIEAYSLSRPRKPACCMMPNWLTADPARSPPGQTASRIPDGPSRSRLSG
ncbi:hypothetical protein OH77DRAFT_1302773 [Trametes cingulata]|nr:hypothetical protein OH77DRAFT_1302773 [Trametes cingulata]